MARFFLDDQIEEDSIGASQGEANETATDRGTFRSRIYYSIIDWPIGTPPITLGAHLL